jgi:hypothetical protein
VIGQWKKSVAAHSRATMAWDHDYYKGSERVFSSSHEKGCGRTVINGYDPLESKHGLAVIKIDFA